MSKCLSSCCHRPSLTDAVQFISVVDMVTSVVFVSYETANFGMLTGLIQKDKNCTNCTTALRDYIPIGLLNRFSFETVTVATLIVLVLFGFIIEGALYSRLKSGRQIKVHLFCKKWFEVRLILLFLSVFMAVGKYFRGFYTLRYDGVTKGYRIICLFIVWCYMRELEDTVGVVYVKPPKPRKRGSLGIA